MVDIDVCDKVEEIVKVLNTDVRGYLPLPHTGLSKSKIAR